MEYVKHALLILSLGLLTGCATTFRPWMLSEIHEGMDRAQVVHSLGEPDYVEVRDGVEHLHYVYRENYNPPLFDDSIYSHHTDLAFENRQTRKRDREYHYVVLLVDGRVQSYKELRD